MKFKKEVGAIISPNKQILRWIEGTRREVLFPQRLAWELHKASPGIIWAFAHTHPPGMTGLTHEDETTLKAWCMALHPWPARFITITEMVGPYFIAESIYLGQLESFEDWQARGKKGARKFTIELESRVSYNQKAFPRHSYINLLLRKSYG